MTINEVIAQADDLRPNVYTPAQKTAWLSEVDGQISVALQAEAQPVSYAWPDDGDTELLLKAPYDKLYGYYMLAMTNFYDSEYDGYNAAATLFEGALGEYLRQYRRTHRPQLSEGFSVM